MLRLELHFIPFTFGIVCCIVYLALIGLWNLMLHLIFRAPLLSGWVLPASRWSWLAMNAVIFFLSSALAWKLVIPVR
jgi:hypothetical protein